MGVADDDIYISVQQADFSVDNELKSLRESSAGAGAEVSFVGLVRDYSEDRQISSMYLEHYPAMTLKSLKQIALQAKQRWQLSSIRIIHRVGLLHSPEQIVMVAVSARHRAGAFSAAEFIMDFLKTQAPIWKREATAEGEVWVAAKDSDTAAVKRW